MARHTIFCNHYRAMHGNDTCKADVPYEKFKGLPFDQRPCFARGGKASPGGCELAVFPTAEELAAEEEEWNKRFANTIIARLAITEHLGGEWTDGTVGASGVIDCPVCKAEKSLKFSRAGYNGHIHAACMTENCVQWME